MTPKDYFEIVIAGITIRFQTDHPSDIDCLEGLFLYHKSTNKLPYEVGKTVHHVIITASTKQLEIPTDAVSVWEGFVSAGCPIAMVWYNAKVANENFVTVGNDIIIHHTPEKNVSTCYLPQKKYTVGESYRPILNMYIFLLIHNILSMYGKYAIHSACVAKNGLAYLFSGKSGNGKTTISTILSKAGFDYMGDDLAFISRNEEGEIVVDSFLCNAKIANESFPLKKLEKESRDVIMEYDFTYSYHQKLGAIFKLEQHFSSEISELNSFSQAEVYTWMLHSGNNIKIQYNPELWLDICEQLTTLPSYHLSFGNKAYFNPDILNDAIHI